MIFEDRTGNRWRRIKQSGLVIGTVSGGGVAVLAGASLMYMPHWGELRVPILSNVSAQVAGVVVAAVGSDSGRPKPAASVPPTPEKSPRAARVLGAATVAATPKILVAPSGPIAPTPTPARSVVATPTPKASTKPTVSPSPSPSPSTTPGKSPHARPHSTP